MPAFQPYWGKSAVRNDREDRGNVGIIRSPIRASIPPDRPLKLYNYARAPNPRRVRIFAAEKGIELSLEEVDILAGQSRTPEFLAKNSSGAVPVLERDDGSYLSESVAICRYMEGLQPEPNLLGRDLRELAEIERWNRRMELELFAPIARTIQNTNPIFQRRFKQFPEYGEAQRAVVYQRLERMDHELDGREFIASDRFTIADILVNYSVQAMAGSPRVSARSS
jgi:glutathione S-transferase